jgi:leader peptidase (prepilin peptidase) / N-methyltransferase
MAGFADTGDIVLVVFVVVVMALLAWYDLKERIIPNRIVLPAWAVVLASQLMLHSDHSSEWLVASGAVTGAFLVPALVYPEGLGMGDVKLAGLIGAALGYNVLTGLLVSTVLAGSFAAAILVHRGSAARRTTIPYGPFLAAGAVAVLLV